MPKRYKKDHLGADENNTGNVRLLPPSTCLESATIVTTDGENLKSIDLASRGNRRCSNPQLHRRSAGSDQGFERGSWLLTRNGSSGAHELLLSLVRRHLAVT